MLLLALDTATSAVTVALHDGSRVIAEESSVDSRRHAETLTPMISSVVAGAGRSAADLTAVAVGVGPGPFTGLRVGLATAASLGLALDIPVHGVCSLDAIAHVVAEGVAEGKDAPSDFVVASDARRKEVYWARYSATGDGIERVSGMPQVSRPADLPAEIRALPAAGRGPQLYPEFFAAALHPLDVPAGALASYALQELAGGRDLLPVQPLYLRQPDAKPATAQKSVLPR